MGDGDRFLLGGEEGAGGGGGRDGCRIEKEVEAGEDEEDEEENEKGCRGCRVQNSGPRDPWQASD